MEAVETKILVLNPFGTSKYDEILRKVLQPVISSGTYFDVRHLERGPEYFDFSYFKKLAEVDVIESIIKAESEGYDGVFVACAYEPGVKEARELVDIPVVGAAIPPILIASQLGYKCSFFTNSEISIPNIWNLIEINGLKRRCISVKAVNLWLDEIVNYPEKNLESVTKLAREAVLEGAEVIILGCTVVAAYFTHLINEKGLPQDLADVTFLDSNVCAIKMLELLVDMYRKTGVKVSRKAYYANPREIKPGDFKKFRMEYGLDIW